jgi:hypothetical protein
LSQILVIELRDFTFVDALVVGKFEGWREDCWWPLHLLQKARLWIKGQRLCTGPELHGIIVPLCSTWSLIDGYACNNNTKVEIRRPTMKRSRCKGHDKRVTKKGKGRRNKRNNNEITGWTRGLGTGSTACVSYILPHIVSVFPVAPLQHMLETSQTLLELLHPLLSIFPGHHIWVCQGCCAFALYCARWLLE